jgi:hypothetical protein
MGMTQASPGRSGESSLVPGHRDKYALVERERRFLVAGPPPGGAGGASRRVDIELGSDADLAACPPPPGSVAEVTSDDRFTGVRLAVTPRAELLGWLAGFGLDADGG